jgi:hypothetical protein
MRSWYRTIIAGGLTAEILLLGGCFGHPESAPYVDDTPEQLAETPVVGEVRGPRVGRLRIDPAEGTHWKQLVDVHLFEGLHPEISVEDAQKRWGQPDREEERPHGPCWIYQRELGVVELCLEEWGSPPFPYVDKWVLHGVPQDSDPQALLDPAVLRLLPSNLEKLDISIMKDEGDRPAVILEIRNGSVERMTWFN